MMYGQGMMNGMVGISSFMWVYMVLLWGFAIFGLIFAIRWIINQGRQEWKRTETAHGVLAMRYARGEITEVEFEKMKKDLQ